jgi:hypothetical protein
MSKVLIMRRAHDPNTAQQLLHTRSENETGPSDFERGHSQVARRQSGDALWWSIGSLPNHEQRGQLNAITPAETKVLLWRTVYNSHVAVEARSTTVCCVTLVALSPFAPTLHYQPSAPPPASSPPSLPLRSAASAAHSCLCPLRQLVFWHPPLQ